MYEEKKLEWWKKGEGISGEVAGTTKGVEEDLAGQFPIRYPRAVKNPDSAQMNPATNRAPGHHDHIAIDTCILLSRESF